MPISLGLYLLPDLQFCTDIHVCVRANYLSKSSLLSVFTGGFLLLVELSSLRSAIFIA